MPVSPKEIQSVNALKPSQSDVKSLPGSTVKESGDGKYTVDVKGRAGIEALRELRRPYARAASELSHKMQEDVERVAVVRPDGTRMDIAATSEHAASRAGFRPRMKVKGQIVMRESTAPAELPRKRLRTQAEIRGLE